jgi:hypothetical protein
MPAPGRPVAEPDEEPNRPQADAHPRAGDHRRPEEGAPTVGGQIYVSIHGTASSAAAGEARRRIVRAARSTGVLVAGINVRLTAPDPTAPAVTVAQANAYADGHPLRVQIVAPTLAQALDQLTERTARRLSERARAWTPRPWPVGAERGLHPLLLPAARPCIARVKTYPLIVCPAQVAAAYMDAMDYDIHLFTDAESGQSAAMHRSGPTGYRLTCLRPTAPPRQTRMPLAIDPRPAPRLTDTAAAARLDETALPHLFFADAATGHGRVLYRRYDGNYGLITGAAA